MAKSAQQIEESLRRMRELGKKLKLLFTALLIVIGISAAVVAVIVISMIADGSVSDSTHTVSIAVPPVYLLICGIGAMTLRGMSCDMARGESPFTLKHAQRICLLGWMFVAAVVIEAITSPGFVSIVIGPFSLINSPQAMFEEPTIPLDMGGILGAIVCFALSSIWRYGALLQKQSEGLV